MSEDEKEAIKYFENKIEATKGKYLYDFIKKEIQPIAIILNLIEDQQNKIEKLKNQNKLASEEHGKRFDEFEVAIENKEKIIDEMAGYIATLDIEEDICSKTENEHCDKMNFGECEDCIKEYFKNKVEE